MAMFLYRILINSIKSFSLQSRCGLFCFTPQTSEPGEREGKGSLYKCGTSYTYCQFAVGFECVDMSWSCPVCEKDFLEKIICKDI